MAYYVNYMTGDGMFFAGETLDEAIEEADNGAAYTQKDIHIYEGEWDEEEEMLLDEKLVAYRRWCGVDIDVVSEGIEGGMDEEEYDNAIKFGDFGFYGAWVFED